jgi:hypothetical protein
MSKYWRLIGDYNGEAQTYEALAGAFQTSPYTPDADGRLIGLRVIVSAEAATSLTEGVQYRLTCTTFTPNTLHVCGAGNGIDTALTPRGGAFDFEVDQPIKAGVPITIEARHAVATAVTHRSFVMGLFNT